MDIGTAASVITLWDLVLKINKLRRAVKDAPEEWQRYRDGLRGIACIQISLDTTINLYPDISALLIEDDGKQRPFVEFINAKVERVRNDASDLINRFDLISTNKTSKAKEFFDWVFHRSPDVCGFLLSKNQISGMVRDVEHAQQQLSMVLTLASINASESWRLNADLLLGTILAEIVKHNETIEKIEGNGRLQRAVLEVDPEAIQPLKMNAPPVPASAEQPGTIRRFTDTVMKQFKRNTRGKPPKHPPKPDGSTSRATAGAGDDIYEADNESDDDCEPPARQSTVATVPAQDAGGPGSNTVEYGLIEKDGKYFQVPLDSAEYSAATGPSGNAGPGLDHPPAATRVDEVVESMSDEELDHAQYRPLEELMSDFVASVPTTRYTSDADTGVETETEWNHTQSRPLEELTFCFVTSAPITPDASDEETETETETVTDEPPAVEIDIRLPTYVLVAEKMDLALCKDGEAAKLNVCVSTASVEGVFCIVEPCLADRKHKCKHITLELEDGLSCAESTPCKIELANLRFLDETDGDGFGSGQSTSPGSALRSNRQCLRDSCYHTKVVDAQHNQTRCALPIKLSARAVFSELPVSSELTVSSEPSVSELPVTPEAQVEVESEDHTYASQLLRDVMLDEAVQIPSEIEWHTFVLFLVMAHKDARHMPEKLLEQARRWVSLFRPPNSFDDGKIDSSDYALVWLWVMWRLHMVEEFKALSSVVQRQARNSISRCWQDGPGSRFGIELPARVLRSLDEKRLDALSRVRNMMLTEIEQARQTYLQIAAAPQFRSPNIQMLASSLSFGYLTLEGERWLPEEDLTHSTPAFSGVSFADVSAAVRSMVDLRDWTVDLAPLAARLPEPLAMFSFSVPVVGPLLHKHSHLGRVQYPESSRVRLAALVQQIENEEWGVDLVETES